MYLLKYFLKQEDSELEIVLMVEDTERLINFMINGEQEPSLEFLVAGFDELTRKM